MHRITRAAGAAALASLALAGVASAHTGGIVATQDCRGFTVTATLNADVAAASTWDVSLNGADLGSGTGPGPATETFHGPVTQGTAQLIITFGGEVNTYTAVLPSAGECLAPPTPRPHVTPAPRVTPPPTSTDSQGQPASDGSFVVVLIGAIAGVGIALYLAILRRGER